VVTALMRPAVVSQYSGFSKIRTAPTSGGFLIISKMSLFSRFLSFRISGPLDACGTENLSLSEFGFLLSAPFLLYVFPSPGDGRRTDSIFSLISVVGSV